MCGIAGYIGDAPLEDKLLDACLAKMGRRGPDHRAVQSWQTSKGQHVHLLHSRLSIIDLDARANQPMGRGQQSLAINGEIYNYLELRAALSKSHQVEFETESDTEVMLQGLRCDGLEFLDRCEGMWAFAYYDSAKEQLSLSRDRFGEKPLYLYRAHNGVYFGSEIKFIFALLGHKLPINIPYVQRYLVNGYKSLSKSDETYFEGVYYLEVGAVVQLDAARTISSFRYWDPIVAQQPDMSYAEAVAEARARLIRSVELRLRADVPLAFAMSGGIDSNSLISIAKNVFDYDVHGFTIVNTDARYEEQDYIDHAVTQQGLKHTALPISTSDFLPNLKTLVAQHDAPVLTITYYAHWLLMSQVAQHGYKISISGIAADELFTGYYDHHNAYLYEVSNDPVEHAQALRNWQKHIAPIVRNPYLKQPDLYVKDPEFRGHIYLGNVEFAQFLHNYTPEPFAEERYVPGVLRNRMMNELFHEATRQVLHEEDLNAMYFSIENRSPFLDRALYEHCYQIPSRHLIRDGAAKSVLREAMRGIVPDKILDNRRKVGFNAPIFDFLELSDPATKAYLLDNSPIFDYVKRDKIAQIIQKDQLPNSESKFLFYFLSTKMFMEQWA